MCGLFGPSISPNELARMVVSAIQDIAKGVENKKEEKKCTVNSKEKQS